MNNVKTETLFELWVRPNPEVIQMFAGAFDVCYFQTEQELNNLFSRPISNDGVVEQRVVRLNALYHTRLNGDSINAIVEQIKKRGEGLENDIQKGLYAPVAEIAYIPNNANVFSFATKYCSFLNPERFPIYDYQVCRVLNFFQRKDHFFEENFLYLEEVRKRKDYQRFVRIVNSFISYYCKNQEMQKLSYKDLDKFMWLVGSNVKYLKCHNEVDKYKGG